MPDITDGFDFGAEFRVIMSQAMVITSNKLGKEVCRALNEEGFSTFAVPSLEEFLSFFSEETPDVVLLDHSSLGHGEAIEVIWRCYEERLPVIDLVPEELLVDYDFSRGSADFVSLPCTPREVTLRVQQLLWRTNGGGGRDVLQFADLRIDLERYEVSLQGRPVLLTYKEYQLLILLASSPGRVYSREILLNRIWGYNYLGGTRTVDVHIRRLRSKLAEAQHAFVETIWNVGYRFRLPEERRNSVGDHRR